MAAWGYNIKSLHMLVTMHEMNKVRLKWQIYFLEGFFLFVLSVSLSKTCWALVSNDIWWIGWLFHWISIGRLHGPVKQFDVLKIAVTNYLMDEIGFNKMKNLSVEFYSNMIDKGIVMSLCINFQLHLSKKLISELVYWNI